MAKQMMCPHGLKPYWSKREAQEANPGMAVKRCAQCRYWHPNPGGTRRAARRDRRKN